MPVVLWLWLAFCQLSIAAREDLTVQEQYDLGVKYMNRGYYVKALEQFNRIRNYYRDDPLAVEAELAIADVYFKKTEWDQARLAYQDFMRMHPSHQRLDYVVYQVGNSVYRKAPKVSARDQVWTRQAVNAWTGFEQRFPESDHLEEVMGMLVECRERLARKELLIARFYASPNRRAWPAVEDRVEGLMHSYPDSQYVPEALELLVVSLREQGRSEEAARSLVRLAELAPERASRLED
ncbi:MAG: outer membrane protein assembly factor BamD [Myxococcota bacterium]|nr:outer membrane protein assembly factor BamD [Myxococcota bacterium]